MAVYVKTNVSGLTWTNTSAWSQSPATGYPGTNGAADEAQWTSATTASTNITGQTVTVGKFTITNPTGNQSTSGNAGTITIDPTAFSGIGIELTSAGSTTFTLGSLTALGSSQTWLVATGRTLAVSGTISGTSKNLTFDGVGAKALSGASTGWTSSTVTLAATSGNQVTASNVNALGASSNAIVVGSGANLTVSAAIAQTAISISGAGFTGGTGYGAFYSTNALAASNTITAAATGTVLSLGLANNQTFAAFLAASPGVTSLTLNLVGAAQANMLFGAASTYDLGAGGTVRLQSIGTNGITANNSRYSFGSAATANDANTGSGATGGGFGASSNAVVVEATGCFVFLGTGTATLNRAYTFIAATSPSVYQAGLVNGAFDFQGAVTISGTAGQAATFIQTPYGAVNSFKFSNSLSGAADVWLGSKIGVAGYRGTFGVGSNLDSSGFTGTVYADAINYSGGGTASPTFPLVLHGPSGSTTYINAIANATAAHASYARATGTAVVFNNTTAGQTGNLTLGGGGWASSPGTWQTDAGTLTLNFSFDGTSGAFTKQGASTLVLGGSNTSITSTAWTAGNLTLNSVNAIGDGADAFTATSTGILDSTTGAVLAQTGANTLNANFTWGGSADLTFGAGALSWNAARTISFLNGKTATLKFRGNIGALINTLTLSVGGSPVGGSRSRLWLAGTNGMLATTSAVTAGYFCVSDSAGLGNALTTMWTVSSNAALEVDGGISPTSARNCTITGPGPNTDGALRSVSGTNTWNGSIIAPVQSLASPTRIQVDSGTFTLAAGTYVTINPTTTGTPLSFCALGSTARLNQPRQLTSNVSDVTINNGGVGTIEISVANNHTGGTTVQGGKCRVTHPTATSTGTVQVNATATLESTVQSTFTTLRLGTSGSGARAILAFAA